MERERYLFHTIRKAMLTLLYWSLNERAVTKDAFVSIIQNESMRRTPTDAHMRARYMEERKFTHTIDGRVYLTRKGLYRTDNEYILESIMHGSLLKSALSRTEFRLSYDALVHTITRELPEPQRHMVALRSLKKRKLIDYTKARVWKTKDVKLINRKEV